MTRSIGRRPGRGWRSWLAPATTTSILRRHDGPAYPVCSNGGANSRAVAEHTILLILAVYRRLLLQHELTSRGRWRGNQPMPTFHEMHGTTLGIIGLGTIGKHVARVASRGFDMRVQYNDLVRLGDKGEEATNVRYRLLPELLSTSDMRS